MDFVFAPGARMFFYAFAGFYKKNNPAKQMLTGFTSFLILLN